jgi:cytidylate kinase
VFDSAILDLLAEQTKVSRETLAALDEDSDVGISFLMSSLLGSPYVVAEDFARDLARTLHKIAEAGDAVIVGRGAASAVQGPGVLNVRVIESFESRLKGLQENRDLSYTEAEILIAERDSTRAQFVEDYFRRDIDDIETYDLIINSAFISSNDVVSLILKAFKSKTSGRQTSSHRVTESQG